MAEARDPDKVCGANTSHGPCQQWKGANTAHKGFGACSRHGGSTPNNQLAADREISKQRMRTYGVPIDTDPLNALLGEVRRSAGIVAWLESRVGDLNEDGQGEQLLDKTMFGPKPAIWIKLFSDERAHLARVCKMAIDSGVQQELLDIMKQNGRALGEFVGAVLHDPELALTAEQLKAAVTIVQRHMQKMLTT